MVHILSDEQIGVIIAGLSKHKNIVINTAVLKGTRNKKATSIGVDDL